MSTHTRPGSQVNANRVAVGLDQASDELMGFPMLVHRFPERASSGSVSIEPFVVTKDDADGFNMRALFQRDARTTIRPGTYVKLIVDGDTMMSDTPYERRTNWDVLHRSHGDVCITGLGLGMILEPIAAKPDVTSITVIERNKDVLALVAAAYADQPKIRVVEGDAMTWVPEKGKRFNVVYHDIWPHVTADNVPQMTALKRRFARWMHQGDPKRWQGCWEEGSCRRAAKESQRRRSLWDR